MAIFRWGREMTEQELYNEYRKSDCKSFTDFLINKISELKNTYRKQRNKRIDVLQKENAKLKNERNAFKIYSDGAELDAINLNDQLIKAKVALRNVIDYLGQFCSDYPDCVIEAEQFIKDSEVEK